MTQARWIKLAGEAGHGYGEGLLPFLLMLLGGAAAITAAVAAGIWYGGRWFGRWMGWW